MRVFIPKHLCWRPDIPDFRDLAPESPEILSLVPNGRVPDAELPSAVKLNEYLLSYPTNPAELACPTSVVCTKLVEYFVYRCTGKIEPLSAQFLTHSAARFERAGCPGIRSNLKAIRQFGIPSKGNCDSSVRTHSDSILSVPGDERRSMHYFRIGVGTCGISIVRELKTWIANGFAIACGFSVPRSLDYDGDIDYRPTVDSLQGGHAALLIGFDDQYLSASKGAFRIFSPWGCDWGDQGTGWLPYSFAKHRMAIDFWTILSREWSDSAELFDLKKSSHATRF